MKTIGKYGVFPTGDHYNIVFLEGTRKNWEVFGFDDPNVVTALDVGSILRHIQEQYYGLDIGYGVAFPEVCGSQIELSKRQVMQLSTVNAERQQEVLKLCIRYVEVIRRAKAE